MDVKELGFIEHGTGKHQSNTVFGTDGVSPTVTTIQGGGTQQIKICDVKQLGHLEKGTGAHQSNIVYDENGLSPCICAGMGVKQQPTMIVDAKSLRMVRTEEGKAIRKAYESGEVHHGFNEFRTAEPREDGVSNTITTVLKDNMILEQCIVAMRGRNPENPSDRTPGIETEQRLEVNSEGICNTLTSVQKDNLVLETTKYEYGRQADIERFVDAVKDREQHLCKLNKMPNGKLASLDDGEICDIDAPLASTVTARYYKGIGAHKDNMVMKSIKIRQATKDGFIDCEVGGVVDLDYPDSQTRRGRVIENGQICPTLTTENIPSVIELGNPDFYNFLYEIDGELYLIRIRKLTPRECWRLMAFTDEDYEKAAKVNSQTQLYKQAGNSIVCKVLEEIFVQMIGG